MKRLIISVILCAMAASAAAAADKKTDKAAPASTAVTIPKDAVKNADGTYSYTDREGKKWLYTKTPFGVIKAAAKDADNPAPSVVKVIDKGDTVRFERPSPFGTMSWEKKKSELTEEEQKMVASQNQSQTAKPEAK